MDSEDVWLNDAGSISSNGFNECWFQDMNMDGTPEFIVGGASLELMIPEFSIYTVIEIISLSI